MADVALPGHLFSEGARPLIGFVILSHRSPGQLMRLCRTLGTLYGDPPIACHHDFAQNPLDTSAFPANVRFVQPSIVTAWARWSLVEATLAALKLLYTDVAPDFFYLLSAADYPIAPAARVAADLMQSQADAYIDAFPLQQALDGAPIVGDPHLAHHRARHNLVLEQGRYLRAQFKVPVIRMRPPAHSTTRERYPRLGRLTMALPLASPLSPFDEGYRCHVGSQWFTGNARAAHKLLSPSTKDRRLQRYYRARVVPDESYFQTVLCNDQSLRCANRTFRFAIWDGAHPIDLHEPDLPAILASRAHFARKFRENDPVLDRLDAALEGTDREPSQPART